MCICLLLLNSVSCKVVVCPQLTILNSMDFNYFSIKVVVNIKLLDYCVILLWMLCRIELIGFNSVTINWVDFLPIVRVCDLFNENCIVLPGNGLRDRLLLVKSIPPPGKGYFSRIHNSWKLSLPLNLMSNFNNYGSKFI